MSNEVILLTLALICGILLILKFRKYFSISIMRISGNSMQPFLKNNELVIVMKRGICLTEGNVYAFVNPSGTFCVKRLHKIVASPIVGKVNLFFMGDNREDSIDSRSYGFILSSRIIGEVKKFKWRNK